MSSFKYQRSGHPPPPALYRQEFPEDSLVLQAGYELIANCLEHPDETTRAAVQRFYDTELASTLRRACGVIV